MSVRPEGQLPVATEVSIIFAARASSLRELALSHLAWKIYSLAPTD